MYAAPPFSHACSAFAVALFVTVWLRVRRHWSPAGVIVLGAAAALMTMVREQDAFYALGPAVDYVLRLKDAGGWRRFAAAPAGIAAFVLCYAPQLLAYRALNGRFGPSTLVTRKMTWTAPHAPGVLASPQHGLFVWTPLALLSVAGLAVMCIRRDGARPDVRRIAGCMVLMLALQVYVSGSVESWTVAGAFGQRRFVGATCLLVIGLAGLWQALPGRWPRLALGTAAALGIWWNVGLMALFGAGLMDRQRLHPRENAYNVFITLPRAAPGLAYRYFTQRESFYETR
jgi:hypothetical protein